MTDEPEQPPAGPNPAKQLAKQNWQEFLPELGTLLALVGVAISLQQNCRQSDEIALLRDSNRPHVRLDLEQNTEGRRLVVSARNVGNIPAVPRSNVFAIVTTSSREYEFGRIDDGGAMDPGDRNLLLQLGLEREFYDALFASTPAATIRACLVYGPYSVEDDRRWVAYYQGTWSVDLNQFQRGTAWEAAGEHGAQCDPLVDAPS